MIPPFFDFRGINQLVELEAQGWVRMDALRRERAKLEKEQQDWAAYEIWKGRLKSEGWND